MRSFLRFLAAMVGFPILLYGIASLTGNWLSTPPWWERTEYGLMTRWHESDLPSEG